MSERDDEAKGILRAKTVAILKHQSLIFLYDFLYHGTIVSLFLVGKLGNQITVSQS